MSIVFAPNDEENYVEDKEIAGGIYHGFMRGDSRHGLGTWVSPDGRYRNEGIFTDQTEPVTFEGIREYDDGEVAEGRIELGKWIVSVF